MTRFAKPSHGALMPNASLVFMVLLNMPTDPTSGYIRAQCVPLEVVAMGFHPGYNSLVVSELQRELEAKQLIRIHSVPIKPGSGRNVRWIEVM